MAVTPSRCSHGVTPVPGCHVLPTRPWHRPPNSPGVPSHGQDVPTPSGTLCVRPVCPPRVTAVSSLTCGRRSPVCDHGGLGVPGTAVTPLPMFPPRVTVVPHAPLPKTQAGTFQGLSKIPAISSGFPGLSRWVGLEQMLWNLGYFCLIPASWKALQEPFPWFLALLTPPVRAPRGGDRSLWLESAGSSLSRDSFSPHRLLLSQTRPRSRNIPSFRGKTKPVV